LQKTDSKLQSIEVARGIAALLVVLYHTARHLDKNLGFPLGKQAFQFGHAGVDFFFVISGFIILYIHAPDLGRPERLGHYAQRRFTRIYPIYWVILAVTIAELMVSGHTPTPTGLDMVWAALLLPTALDPIVGVSWTLQSEVIFYIVFAVSILNSRIGRWVMALWFAAILFALAREQTGIAARLASSYSLEFFLGMAVAYRLLHGTVPSARTVLTIGLTLFIAVSYAEVIGLMDGYKPLARLAYGVPSALIILGLVQLERMGSIAMPASLLWLGRSSYSIYLFHLTIIGLAYKVAVSIKMPDWSPLWISFITLVTAGIGGSVVISVFIEYPLMRWTRQSISHRRSIMI